MKKKFTLFVLLSFLVPFITLGMTQSVSADEQTPADTFRVGMEAGYAPFNWTQTSDSHGAVPIGDSNNSWAGGYDVQIAKKIADGLGKKLEIVKTDWDGLPVALQSGRIDAVIAGMSPTAERKKEIDFSDPYYESDLVVVVKADSKYANATSLKDFTGAKITAQQSTFHYTVIDQIPEVDKRQASKSFSQMRAALLAGDIDGYVSERPEGVTAETADKKYKMVEFTEGQGFETNPEDVQVAIGMRKGDADIAKVNQILAGISADERIKLMDQAIEDQPVTSDAQEEGGLLHDFKNIWNNYGKLFLQGAGLTLFIALFSTVVGTGIGLLIGVFRTLPKASSKLGTLIQKLCNGLLTIYIEVFRGTPMMVQAMVIFYGLGMAFGINLDRTFAALLIVSINTGAYMSEIVRGGIFAVDAGQFEAAQAIGMTHGQTMRKVVLPQVLRNILPATGNEVVINIKDTAVLSVISVADLFFQGNSAAGTNYQYFQTFAIIGLMYLVMTITVSRLLRFVESRLDGPASYEKTDTATSGELKE